MPDQAGNPAQWSTGQRLQPSSFPAHFKATMIAAYPIVAGMDADEAYFATSDERDEAFQRILDNRHLRRTAELFLQQTEPPSPSPVAADA